MSENPQIENEKLKLKNFAFCSCLSKSNPSQKDFFIQDGSTSGYYQTSKYDLKAIDRIDSLAAIYAKVQYRSYENKTLSIMKCLDFYNSRALDSLINQLDTQLDIGKKK